MATRVLALLLALETASAFAPAQSATPRAVSLKAFDIKKQIGAQVLTRPHHR
jgi:hypothetical protein